MSRSNQQHQYRLWGQVAIQIILTIIRLISTQPQAYPSADQLMPQVILMAPIMMIITAVLQMIIIEIETIIIRSIITIIRTVIITIHLVVLSIHEIKGWLAIQGDNVRGKSTLIKAILDDAGVIKSGNWTASFCFSHCSGTKQ